MQHNKTNLLAGFFAAASGALALAGAIGGWSPSVDVAQGVSVYVSLFSTCTADRNSGGVKCVTTALSNAAVAGGVLLLIGAFFGFLDLLCVFIKACLGWCKTKRDA